MAELVPFNTDYTLYFPLVASGTATLSTLPSGSLSGTNIQWATDGSAWAVTTNTGTVAPGSGWFKVVLDQTELTGSQTQILIAGGTLSTIVEVQNFLLKTFGSVGAAYLGDWPATLMAGHTIATVSTVVALLTGTVSTVTSPIGTVSTVVVVLGTPAVDLVTVLGTAVDATQGTLTNVGTVGLALGTIDANLVTVKGTTVAGTQRTLESISTVSESTLAAVPGESTSVPAMVSWMYNLSRNQIDQITGTQLAFNQGNTLIATSITNDDGGSFRRGSFV